MEVRIGIVEWKCRSAKKEWLMPNLEKAEWSEPTTQYGPKSVARLTNSLREIQNEGVFKGYHGKRKTVLWLL